MMAPPGVPGEFLRSATLLLRSLRYGLCRGRGHTGSCTSSPARCSSVPSSGLLVSTAGMSPPSATRAAPVSVAKSMHRSLPSSAASARASASTSLPSASVLVISVVSPFLEVITSPGRMALPPTLFSTAGTSTRKRTRRFVAMMSMASPRAWAPPAMSFFISFMVGPVLMFRPPVSKHTPLPTMYTRGSDSSSPQASLMSLGSLPGSAARPTACICG
mmetsp:Transcript_1970/g.6835  ORF Transcript_1970/g.6835 Transcript_1970/m.6835 type:complete len:217 (-) Transcript_1970:993-1643(-)